MRMWMWKTWNDSDNSRSGFAHEVWCMTKGLFHSLNWLTAQQSGSISAWQQRDNSNWHPYHVNLWLVYKADWAKHLNAYWRRTVLTHTITPCSNAILWSNHSSHVHKESQKTVNTFLSFNFPFMADLAISRHFHAESEEGRHFSFSLRGTYTTFSLTFPRIKYIASFEMHVSHVLNESLPVEWHIYATPCYLCVCTLLQKNFEKGRAWTNYD